MARDRDNPIREYFEVDLPEKRFREQEERMAREDIEDFEFKGLGERARKAWRRDWEKMFKDVYPGMLKHARVAGGQFLSVYESMMFREAVFPLVRWKGCLWHLVVHADTAIIAVDDEGEHRHPVGFKSACGETFSIRYDSDRLDVEATTETYPHQHLVCMKCWEAIQSLRVALILGGADVDSGNASDFS